MSSFHDDIVCHNGSEFVRKAASTGWTAYRFTEAQLNTILEGKLLLERAPTFKQVNDFGHVYVTV